MGERGEVIDVGVVTPHAAAGAEAEFPDMAPSRVRVSVSRTGPPAAEPPSSPEGLREHATPAAIDDAAARLPDGVDVLALSSTSTGYALGHEAETAMVARASERWGRPACATSAAAVAALRSLGVGRVDVVHPPWFGEDLNELGAAYFTAQGVEVVDARLADLPNDPARVEPAMVVEWVARHASPRAEAVFLGGNGFRAALAVHELEARLGRPVLAANQVLLWAVLRAVGAAVAVPGFGVLLADRGDEVDTP